MSLLNFNFLRGTFSEISWPEAVAKGEILARFFIDNGLVNKRIALIGQYNSAAWVAFVSYF